MTRLISLLSIFAAITGLSVETPADHAKSMKEGLALFRDTIGPAIEANCLKCHGGEKVRGELNLASRELLLKGGESGAVIDLDKPAASLLMTLITHAEEPEMPPKKPKLAAGLIADFGRWIQLGAPYDKPLIENAGRTTEMVVTDNDRNFWAFRPLAAVQVPAISDKWVRTDVDRFIRQKQQEQKLSPNPAADKNTLARRAYLDLLGMPPSPAELQQFLADESPRAWEKLIDRLLASDDYGPRWARYWMDVARFGESSGFEQNYDRKSAYHYRDFLIQAFNQDMPWDQFTSWQLAGDELAPDNHLAMMATGFLSAGVFPTQLTEAEFESARYDEIDDMVGTTSMAFLGLSVACARCHDHKYDPIPARDYYAMAATFATAIRSEASIPIAQGALAKDLAEWQKKHEAIEADLAAYRRTTLEPAFVAWLQNPANADLIETGTWGVLEPTSVSSKGGATLTRQADASWLASGKSPDSDTYTIVAKAPAGTSSLRLEALTHSSFKRKGPGRATNGNFALSDLAITATIDKASIPIDIASARATHQQNTSNLSVASSFDANKQGTGWAVDLGGIGKDQAAIFTFDKPLATDAVLTFKLNFAANTKHSLGRFRLAVTDQIKPDFELNKGASASLAEAAVLVRSGKPQDLSEAQREALRDYFSGRDPTGREKQIAVQESLAQKPVPQKSTVMICSEGVRPIKHHADGRGYPHFYKNVHLLSRGDPKQKGEVMQAGFLNVLMPSGKESSSWHLPSKIPGKSFRRASLANWMTDTESGAGHLLARVIVNRIWYHHFGRGIVTTTNDFGFQGERPSHAELLDWLARDFIKNGWHLKRLHRQIMSSAVYRQSTAYDAERSKLDVDNNLLWRFAPRRLEAEAIRDSHLSVSGLLDPKPFGPGTLNENMRRRSIYFTVRRSAPPNCMIVFDWPEHLVSIGQRASTTIAPQALHFMNSPQVRVYADGLAKRTGTGPLESRVRQVYDLALNRPVTDEELKIAEQFMRSQAANYASDKTAEERAFVDFCQAILGSNEFLYLQ